MSQITSTILLIGAPSAGKTSVLNRLQQQGFLCFEEISRQVTQNARDEGIVHLFKTQPLLFSQRLLEGRIKQFLSAKRSRQTQAFIDRGLPDITAYLDMVKIAYPQNFIDTNRQYRYDKVFWFPLWKNIYISDAERYEDFEMAKNIENHLIQSYKSLDYELITMPRSSVDQRVDFILSYLNIK
jgi:predicted ATPase